MALPYLFIRSSGIKAPPKFYEFYLILERDMLIRGEPLINLDKIIVTRKQ